MHEFQEALESARTSGSVAGVLALLADDVVFRSPVVYKPYRGRSTIEPLLHAVVRVFDDFGFTRHIGSGSNHAFVFQARIGDRQIEGCDFVHMREDGLIDEFWVMVRPLSGAMALAQAMQQQIDSRAA